MDLAIEEKITLKGILKKQGGRLEMDLSSCRYGHGTEPPGSMKGGELVEWMRYCQLLRKKCVA